MHASDATSRSGPRQPQARPSLVVTRASLLLLFSVRHDFAATPVPERVSVPSTTRAFSAMRSAIRQSLVAVVLAGTLSGCIAESLIKQPELSIIPGLPAGWSGTAATSAIGTTVTEFKSGRTSAYLSGAFQLELKSFTLVQYIKADDYRGKRIQLSAWVKPRNVTNVVNSGIWMRVDGFSTTLGYDDMAQRPVGGYGDWRKVAVVMDVPQAAIGIAFGALFQASNTLLVDDMHLDIVGTDIVSTSRIVAPISNGNDSTSTVAQYASSPRAPVNLDFEGLTASAVAMRR